MGNSTIGTNIVTDGSTEYELLKALLERLSQALAGAKDNAYAKSLKMLMNYLNRGGSLDFKLVENKYLKDFEQALNDEHIPYILLPNDAGETAIAIRDKDCDAFLEIQQRIFSKSTDYWKELSIQDFHEIIQNDPRLKHEKIPVLTFEENEMRLIAAQKLYGNNVVTSYTNGKMIVYPESVYGKGGDLVDAQLDMAFEQAKGDGIKGHGTIEYDLLSVRKAQAKYDQETLFEFCKAFKEGHGRSLWDASGQSKIGLTINRDGDIELCTPKPGFTQFMGEESIKRTVLVKHGDDIDETGLFGLLSKDAGNIYNMVCCTNAERNEILAGNTIGCKRPKYRDSKEKAIYRDMKTELQTALDAVKARAYQVIEDDHKNIGKMKDKFESKESKAHRKEAAIIKILENRDHPAIQAWLSSEVRADGDLVLTRADKNALLDKVIEHFKDNHENSRDEMQVDYIKASELKEMFEEKKASAERTAERENDSHDRTE